MSNGQTRQRIPNVFKIIKDVCDTIPSNPLVICGGWEEVSRDLTLMGLNKTKDGTKYPCIIINSNTTFKSGTDKSSNIVLDKFQIYIVCQAKMNEGFLDSQELRYNATIYPLADEMFEAFDRSNLIDVTVEKDMKGLNYEAKQYPFIKTEAKDQNQLNDIVDAMLFTFKEFKLKNIYN